MRGSRIIGKLSFVGKLLFFLLVFLGLWFTVFAITGFATENSSPSNVSVTPFTVLALTFNGSTTNFSGQSESTYTNFPLVILEKTIYGKVEFKENLNIVIKGGSNATVNFDRDLNISENLIDVDDSVLTGINKKANLSFYGISFSVPRIYHDGVICTDCTQISYSGGVYKFNVTSFNGVYWLAETPALPVCGNSAVESGETCDDGNTISGDGCSSTCQTESTGGNPGGGGVPGTNGTTNETNTSYNFQVIPSFFQLSMNKGTYYQQLVNVTNIGYNPLAISIRIEELQSFIFPAIGSFSLKPGESKVLRFDIYVSDSRPADVYVGKINLISPEVKKDIEVVLQVEDKESLFDIRTEVLKKYITPGGRVRANITLINKRDVRNFDIQLEYKAIDFDKKEYSIKKEDFTVDNQYYTNIFSLDLPKDIPVGNYLFYTKITSGNASASSYDTFVVERISTISWIILIAILLIAMYLVYRRYSQQKEKLKFEPKKENVKKKFGKNKPFKTESVPRSIIKAKDIDVPKLPNKLEKI
ncbi:MAG: DUF4215 domain-containing protein [archaeon]|nr:DUF4215 domain-containing protein [archaeon]